MKTYILRDPQTVEPQKPIGDPKPEGNPPWWRRPGWAVAASTSGCEVAPVIRTKCVLRDPRRRHDDVLKLLKKLQTAHPDTVLKFCYEAGPRGCPLCRFI